MNHATTSARTQHPRPSSTWTGWAQWLALITMTLDHIARYLANDAWGMGWVDSSVGRIAFPLFAGMVAWHGRFNARDPLRYARRIMVIGLVAQLPYQLMPREAIFQLNICFTLALGLMAGYWLEQVAQRTARNQLGLAPLSLETLGVVAAWYLAGFWVEYGHSGLLLIPLYMLAIDQRQGAGCTPGKRLLLACAMAVPVLLLAGTMNSSIMARSITVLTTLAVLAMAFGVDQRVPDVRWKMPRRLWLAWYPAHFAVIAAILLLEDRAAYP